jgi:hypothetical protein
VVVVRGISLDLTEREVCFNPRLIRFIDSGHFA